MCFAYIWTRLGPELGVSQQRPHLILPSTWKVCSLTCPVSYQVAMHYSTISTPPRKRPGRKKKDVREHGKGTKPRALRSSLCFLQAIVKNVKLTYKTKIIHKGNASFSKTRPVLTPSQNVWSLGCTCIRAPLFTSSPKQHLPQDHCNFISKAVL